MIVTLRRKFKSLTKDKKFSEILMGSAWTLPARVAATVLGLITTVIITRSYGAEMLGILSVIQAVMMFATIFTVMGTNISILRLIPEHVVKNSATSAFKVYRKIQYFVAVASLLVGALLFLTSDMIASEVFGKPYLHFYFALAACFVVFRSLMDLNVQAVRGLRLIKVFAFMQVLPSVALLLALITITILHGGENSPVYAQIVAWVITAIVSTWIMDYMFRKRMRPGDSVQSMSLREILNISTPMMMTASMGFVIGQTGVILLGIFTPEAEVGYYSIAVKLATLTTFVLQAINSMAAPNFSALYQKGAMDELFYVAKKSTRLIFWTTVPILLLLLIFGRLILARIFGGEFTAAYPALAMLVIGQFVNSISGSTGIFMNMTGHQKVFRNIMLIAALINTILCFVLIPHYGITGAACAGMICLGFWNFYALSFIKTRYGKTIGYFPFL